MKFQIGIRLRYLFMLAVALPLCIIIPLQNHCGAAEKETLDQVVRRVAPAVVKITGYMHKPGTNKEFSKYNQSSEFFFDNRGYLFTVYSSYVHRMSRRLCEKFEIVLSDGRVVNAGIFAVDPLINLAILKISLDNNYPKVDISLQPRINTGEPVVALFAKGFDEKNFYTQGVIKAKNKTSMYGAGLVDLLIDIDLILPDYAYGGPLINEKGEIIGMNMHDLHKFTAADQVDKEGHALPISLVNTNYKMLMAFPTFDQPWLGLSARALNLEEAASFYRELGHVNGLLIDFVWPEGPAARSGFRAGDILLGINGKNLRAGYELDRLIFEAGIGTRLECRIFRYGTGITIKKLVSEKRPP